jgi:Mg-chelatase subunit ChlD
MTVLAFVVGITLGATGALADKNLADKNVGPSTGNLIINYPAYPNSGGPYIVGATYDPNNDRVVLVFNEAIDATSVSTTLTDDFQASFNLADTAVSIGDNDGDNVLYILGVDPADVSQAFTDNGTERIHLKLPGVLAGLDASLSDEVGWVPIGQGPIPTRVELVDPNATADSLQTLRVYWDAATLKVGAASATFGSTAEMSGVTFGFTGTGSDTWTLRDSSTVSPPNFRYMVAGITKLRVTAGQVKYAGVAQPVTNVERIMVVDNTDRGPVLIAAYYDTKGTASFYDDDAIWAVFNEPVDPASFPLGFLGLGDTNFGIVDGAGGGGITFNGTAGGSALAFPGSTTASIKITGFTGTTALPDFNDMLRHKGTLPDFQGEIYAVNNDVVLHNGPGIIRACYDDGQTVALNNDKLVIWLSEPISNPAQIDTLDFTGDGEWEFGSLIQVLVEANVGGQGKVTFSNFTNARAAKRYRPGIRVRATNTATPVLGDAARVIDIVTKVPIIDESRPFTVGLREVALTDRWDSVALLDTLDLAWREDAATADDGDQFFLFITRKSPLDITNEWMNVNQGRAIPIGNLRPGTTGDTTRVRLLIDYLGTGGPQTIKRTTDDEDIGLNDQVRFLVAAADYTGNTQYRTQLQGSVALLFGAAMWVGPICPPQDWYLTPGDNARWDSDIIHVTGDSTGTGVTAEYTFSVFGDTLAVPCSADSVIAYFDPIDDPDVLNGNEVRIGAGPVKNRLASDSSFDPFVLTFPDPLDRTEGFIYLAAKMGTDVTPAASMLPIRLDAFYPGIQANQIFDPWNPYQIYNALDYVNIRFRLNDRVSGTAAFGTNDIARVVADFSLIDSLTTNAPGFTTPPDSIVMVGLGRDRLDNDGDWWSQLVTGADNDPVDVGLDGLPNTGDLGEDNGLPTPGDPFVDENGNGVFDPGETFVDLVNQTGQSGVYDPGEPFIDCDPVTTAPGVYTAGSADPDEAGWYEIRTPVAADRGKVIQGYKLDPTRVRKLAYTDPLSLVKIIVVDNGADGTIYPEQPQRPGMTRSLSLDQTKILDGTDPQQRFMATIDFHEPTVSEITNLENGNGSPNMIVPGIPAPVYHLGQYLDITVSTPSDSDVLFTQLQLLKGATWQALARDPEGDANGDGFPGDANFSEDFALAGESVNAAGDTIGVSGVDDDQNGIVDDAGEGIDLRDREVHNAGETEAQDAANTNGDGVSSENDRRDNDNDAYFKYSAFDPGDPVNPTAGYGKVTWWNVDESPTNLVDDDGDGVADPTDTDEYQEGGNSSNATRYLAANDDDEDGIADGEALAVVLNGTTSLLGGYTGAYPITIYVAASKVLGMRTSANTAAADSLARFYANGAAYTEPIAAAYANMTSSVRRLFATGYDTDVPEPRTDWAALTSFNWHTLKGSDIDLNWASRVYGLLADGATTYKLRGLAYDRVGNSNASWSEPISFTIDLTGPLANIDGCDTDSLNVGSDFADKNTATADIIEIWDAGQHPGTYTLALQSVDPDAQKVQFQERRRNADGTWPEWLPPDPTGLTGGPRDLNAPFTTEWPFASDSMFTVNNYPAARYQDVQFRAVAWDAQNNQTLQSDLCVFEVRVIDSTPPSSWIRGIYRNDSASFYVTDDYTPLGVTVSVPRDSSINIWVRIEDNDRDAMGRLTTLLPEKSTYNVVHTGHTPDSLTTMWAAGIDGKTGNALANDDGDGATDEDDPGGFGGLSDGIYTLGSDSLGGYLAGDDTTATVGAGPDSISGTADDEWGRGTNNDDYITNDVKYVVWQYRRVNPPTEWLAFATVHGDDGTGGQVFDYTQPMKATLNTAGFTEGIYELRAYACDVEGNCNIDTAPIATIAVRANPLRAYIQPEVCSSVNSSMFDLYAVHFIHDYEIDKVRFEYTAATDSGCVVNPANPDTAWKLIAIDEAALQGDSRGDPVLYMPKQFVPSPTDPSDTRVPDPIQTLGAGVNLAGTVYKYWDADSTAADGYSSRDPVVSSADLVWGAGDTGVIGDASLIPSGATLTAFAANEFYAQTIGEAAGLDPTDWIFRENSLNGDNNQLDRWSATWDATGLPPGKYLVRAIAIDAQNNMDEITYTCYAPDMQNPEELELVNLSTTPPHAAFTTMIVPDVMPGGTSVNLHPSPASVIYVPGSAKWVKLNATAPGATKLKFEYKIEGITGWTVITPNDDDVFFADIDGTVGYSGVTGFDEVFNDLNGDFVKSPGDFVKDDGVPDGVQTPSGWPMYPQTSGDPTYAVRLPFHVYLDTGAPGFPELMTDTSIQIRVTAYDEICDGSRSDPSPEIVTLIWGESQDPVADIIRAEDLNGTLVDVSPEIHDHTPVGTIGAGMDTMRVFVTAEDMSTINFVDLYYRLDPNCYTSVPTDQQQRPTDLVLVLDGSASITPASFTLQKEGVAAALADPGIIPTDGSVTLAVVQFGNGVGVTLFPRTTISSPAVAAGLATQVLAMVQLADGTPTAAGINRGVEAIGAGTPGARQVMIVATDGPPTVVEGDPTDPVALALAAADNAMTHGIDELHALGIGASVDMVFLAQLVRHGTAEQISSYTGFANAIGAKIQSIIFNTLVDVRQWRSMTAAGWLGTPGIDATYPYDFNIATDMIPNGVYQMYPRAYDQSGNFNQAPINPWGFKKFELADSNFAYICPPTETPIFPDTAAVGDEYVIHGCLYDPAQAGTTAMRFYYAPRILNEVIDAAQVQPVAPFTAPALDRSVLGGATGNGVVLTINGTAGTYHSTLAGLAAPTMLDFTLVGTVVGDTLVDAQVVFGARPASTDEILVSYNFGSWTQIGTGDSWSPYTVAWSQVDGGVPPPTDPATDAYDIIAVAMFDVNGDGVYDTNCDYTEGLGSEGHYLFLQDVARPRIILYGLAYQDFDEPFAYLDWNWPGNPLFRSGDELGGPNYENKLSGIETDVFVTATDFGGGDVDSVKLDITETDVAGGTTITSTVDMTKISTGTTISLPITFYEDDYYSFWVTGTGMFTDSTHTNLLQTTWDSGTIENVVLEISLDGGHSWARSYQMVHDAATRSWSAVGRFDIGIIDSDSQRYRFIVDLVGDQQEAIPDARNMHTVAAGDSAHFISALNVPSLPFWYTHLDNATQLRNNAFHRVVVTATDTFGNTGSNLLSWMPGDSVAQGPIVFVLDETPPVVNSITLLNSDNQPVTSAAIPRIGAGPYKLMANVSDLPFTDINVQAIRGVIYQYTANHGQTWVTIGVGYPLRVLGGPALGGQWVIDWAPPNPLTDGYDNDGDGLWDEPDEAIADLTIRAIAFDDGMNTGFSDQQTPAVTLVVTVDGAQPTAALDHPLDGEVFGYSDPILLSGTVHGDYLPPAAGADVDIVRFQAKINRYFYVDETKITPAHDATPAETTIVGQRDVYENGLDEVWWDKNNDHEFSAADSCLYAGADSVCFAFNVVPSAQVLPPANFWFDLDPTPQDNSDDPWLTSPNNGSSWEMTWVPSGYVFINADVLGGDEYVRLRLLSRDTAGNWDTATDLLPPKETVIILNDTTVTRAYITRVGTNDQDGIVDPAETRPVQGLGGVNVYGKMLAAGLEEVVQVNVYVVTNPDGAVPDTSLAFIDNTIGEDGLFEGVWAAGGLPETEYLLFATAVDIDQNESSKHDATKVRVRIDRTPPVVNYTPVGSYAGFTTAVPYVDDGIVNHSSMVIFPDIYTGDVNFMVTTTASDVASMVLQWRFANDPVGLWRAADEFFVPTVLPHGAFDYEPGQDFTVGGVLHHVWWLHLENFADPARMLSSGRLEFRALASDEAGNSNALQTAFAEYTADDSKPGGFDWNDDSVTNQIEVGSTVHFEISGQDSLLDDGTRTDIVKMALFVRQVGAAWPSLPYATVVPEGQQIDTGNAMWIGRFAWVAPAFVVHDTGYEFGVVMTDAAGNSNEIPWQRTGGYVITVEDNAAPDRTKIIDVVALTYQVADSSLFPDNPDVWKDNSTLLADMTKYQPGTDWLISEGASLTPPALNTSGVAVGDACATFPRNVGESYLNDARIRNTVKVARTVTLVGRTQSDDDGIGQLDTGIQWVTFLLAPCDANGVLSAQSEWITLGRDEYAPAFPLFYWNLTWNTELYPDGTYKLAAYAQDEEGNIEDMTSLDWSSAIIVIDNEGPSAQMDADSHTDVVEKTVTVERNRPFTLFARTLVPGTATLQNYEDDTIEFWYKRARDLNMADSWASVPDSAGAVWDDEFEDGNPDSTRPYSFDVGMGRLFEPTDTLTNIPLSVGETYDFVAAADDEVCNETTHIDAFADSLVVGVGTRYIRLLIQDTIAPHLEFTSAVRKAAPYGDEDVIENPTKIHAQGFHYIEARLLTGDLDMDHAEFVYRPKGTTTWNLVDAVLTATDSKRTWTLGEWDLQTLQHNTWYEIAAIGVDDVGNVDQNPDIIDIYVDYEAPPSTLVSPAPATSKWCNGVKDLVVTVDRGASQQHDDVFDVIWMWKLSTDPDVVAPDTTSNPAATGWKTLGVATVADLYDDATNKYSNTLNLDGTINPIGPIGLTNIFGSNLYDLRVMVADVAGNVQVYDVYKNTVDITPPDYVRISNIKLNGDDTTQDPIDQGQYTDVTAGTMVEIFGTASDNEPALPDDVDPQTGVFYETMIASMQFQVAFDLNQDGAADGASWHDIGVVKLDPPTLGDMSAQTSSILWNTTGLPEGDYLLRVIATDECGLSTIGAAANVRVLDWTPPIARIVAWDADQQPHGTPAPSFLTIYALAECDTTDAWPDTIGVAGSIGWQPTYDVQLQYNVKDTGETVPIGDWVNIGIAVPVENGERFTTEQLWAATIDPNLFGTMGSVWLRALVRDENGNRYGDDPADIIPTALVNIVPQVDELGVADGTLTIKQVPSAELQGGSQMVQKVSWMIESPTHIVLTVKMAVQDQAPRVILLSEPANPIAYPSDDNPLNYSPGVPVGLTRSIDDPTVWRGEIFLEDPDNCTHYAFWVSGLDGTMETAKWIDLMDAYMREFSVTTALGTNGTVKTPAYGSLGADVKVVSGAWPGDPTCLLVSPTDPPYVSTDQSRYLSPIDQTAYHMQVLSSDGPFVHGYEPLVTIKYSQDMATAALTGTESTEEALTVRRWEPENENRDGSAGAWVGTGISQIKVYPNDNKLTFRVRDLSSNEAGPGGGTAIAFVVDGSGSMDNTEFGLQLEGIAAALENASIVPRDGSVSVAVIQFSGTAQNEIPLTQITNAGVAASLATQVRAIDQLACEGDFCTNTAAGIEMATTLLSGAGAGTRRSIMISTDGGANVGSPDGQTAAIAAADAAIAAGVNEISGIGVGAQIDMAQLEELVRNGTSTQAQTFNDYAAAVEPLIASIVSGGQSGGGAIFQLFVPKKNAPVVVSSIWPSSPYVTDWQTDADPVIVVYLRHPGGQAIDPTETELSIDGNIWASWMTGAGDAQFVRGNGKAVLTYANLDHTVMELKYQHSTYPRDWLTNGPHLLTVRYGTSGGTDDWMEGNFTFNVDRKAPYIEFDGGFVGSTRLSNVMGYMNPQQGKLIAKMYDAGTGILFKHDRPWYFYDADQDGILDPIERQSDPTDNPSGEYGCGECPYWIRADWGIKYDVWRIHTPDQQPPHDHQNDIDNIEVRTLLHQGTADELEPWITVRGKPNFTMDQYVPGTDTLRVPVAVVGGGMIKDNDIIEITWYSDKSIEQNSDGPGYGCIVDTMLVNGTMHLYWDPNCAYDSESQEMHIYNEGVQDWASNTGSKYVEQRFIVDTNCPTISFVEPAALTVDPNGDLHVVVIAVDDGVGIGSFVVTIKDPSGNVVTPAPADVQLVGGRYQAIIRGPLLRGEYSVTAVATDLLGNGCDGALAVRAEALVLAMTEVAAAPNPFNPQGSDQHGGGLMTIGFTVARKSDVTIKIYDFAGLEVATVRNQVPFEAGHWTNVTWAGEASDGTPLSNGAYICRITATDGVKTVDQSLKLVIWRE